MKLGAQFTCFTSTNVQILSHEVLLFSTLERREQVKVEERHTQHAGAVPSSLADSFFFFGSEAGQTC